MKHLGPIEVSALLTATAAGGRPTTVLDVREAWEVQVASLHGAVHIPMREIPARFGELDRNSTIVCLCHHGARSMQVAMFLEHQGFADVCNLSGGIDAWSRQVDPAVPTY